MALTQPWDATGKESNDPWVSHSQYEMDTDPKRGASVPIVWRWTKRADNNKDVVQVVSCLSQVNGEVTLGSGDDCDVVLRHPTDDKGLPIHISRHACKIFRVDDETKKEVCLFIDGGESQELSGENILEGVHLTLFQHVWGDDGKLANVERIRRIAAGRTFSITAKHNTSPCIQVSHNGKVLDQIFISVPTNWTRLFEGGYKFSVNRPYHVPVKVGEYPPKRAETAITPLTQASVESGATLQLSQAPTVKKEEVLKVNQIFGQGLYDDPVSKLRKGELYLLFIILL
jgi:hypothetical protein